MEVTWIGCAAGNFSPGRAGHKPDLIVIHLMDGTLQGTDTWFLTPPSERNNGDFASSAHYGIGKAGQVHQYVHQEDEAFHAGRVLIPTAKLVVERHGVNPNLYSIGIEHEGTPTDEWPDEMIEASAQLVAQLAAGHEIPLDRDHVVGHHEIFSAKSCPGDKCPIDQIVERAKAIFNLPT